MQNQAILFLFLCSVVLTISATIDLDSLFNYADQFIPDYIAKDNTPESNLMDDRKATQVAVC